MKSMKSAQLVGQKVIVKAKHQLYSNWPSN